MSAKQQNVPHVPARPPVAFALILVGLLVVVPLLLAVALMGAVPDSLDQNWGPIRHPWSVPAALAFWLLVAAGIGASMNWLLKRIVTKP